MQERTSCSLLGKFHDGNKCVIAQGLVHPKTAEEKIHCVDLAEDLVRVYVTEVPQTFRHFSVKYPPNPE